VGKLFIIGFIGSGKSTYAQELAARLTMPHIDLDRMIESRHGKTITEIFEKEGEKAFREIESVILKEVAAGDDAVISVGGGAPCNEVNLNVMKESGRVIYLKLPRKVLHERLATMIENRETSRPLLTGLSMSDLNSFITRMLRERERWYLQADVVVDPRWVLPETLAREWRSDM